MREAIERELARRGQTWGWLGQSLSLAGLPAGLENLSLRDLQRVAALLGLQLTVTMS